MHTEIITIGIVDTEILNRKGHVAIINAIEDCSIVFDVDNFEVLQQVLNNNIAPQMLLLNHYTCVKNGFEMMFWIQKNHPDISIIIINKYEYHLTYLQLIQLGARAFLKTDITESNLKKAVHSVIKNGLYFTDVLDRQLLAEAYIQDIEKYKTHTDILTPKELMFLQLACTKLTYKEIAVRMDISPRCINKLCQKMFAKFKTRKRFDLAIIAMRNGIAEVA